ncbi:MAG TPA: hypothetical protein PKO33_17615, partial [Pyrinomonadaceae bacterium]|nr:hypothetical protein [Pyrinomonadaceae bacterium]
MKPESTRINRLIFFFLCALIVFATVGYGAVHQPIIAFTYLIIALAGVLWAVDSIRVGVIRLSRSAIQLPIILTVVYAFVQIIPFGTLADMHGV